MIEPRKDLKPTLQPIKKPRNKTIPEETIPRRESWPVKPVSTQNHRLRLIETWDTSPWTPYAVGVILGGIVVRERVLVASVGNNVNVFNPTGNVLADWPLPVFHNLSGIRGLNVDNRTDDGRVFVAMQSSKFIHVLNRNGTVHASWQGSVAGTGIIQPYGIVVLHDGNLIISCISNHTLNYFTPEGVHYKTIGSFGSSWGELNGPRQLAYDDRNGDIYIVERPINRISVFNHSGSCLRIFGGFGTSKAKFNTPDGIALDKNKDVVFVSDSKNKRIQVLKTDGSYLTSWNDTNKGSLFEPADMAIGMDGRLYVTCPETRKVYIFEYGPKSRSR